MNEKVLLKIALVCSIVGLVGLFVFSKTIQIQEVAISKIDGTQQGVVKVFGTVASIRHAGQGMIVEVSQPSTITVFVSSNVSMVPGDKVEIIGRVDEYKGKQEIVAERIRILKSNDS